MNTDRIVKQIIKGKSVQAVVKRMEAIAKVPQSNAYWISPVGEIMAVDDVHIYRIIQSPESFGLTRDDIEKAYADAGERIGQEGNAREAIIRSLVNKGYIRIRNYARAGFWSVNVNAITQKVKDYLQEWAEAMIGNGASEYDEVVIDTINAQEKHTLGEIARFSFDDNEPDSVPQIQSGDTVLRDLWQRRAARGESLLKPVSNFRIG